MTQVPTHFWGHKDLGFLLSPLTTHPPSVLGRTRHSPPRKTVQTSYLTLIVLVGIVPVHPPLTSQVPSLRFCSTREGTDLRRQSLFHGPSTRVLRSGRSGSSSPPTLSLSTTDNKLPITFVPRERTSRVTDVLALGCKGFGSQIYRSGYCLGVEFPSPRHGPFLERTRGSIFHFTPESRKVGNLNIPGFPYFLEKFFLKKKKQF